MKEWIVELTRGGRVESLHRVRAAVVLGRRRLGDVGPSVFLRSAAKPLQALAVLETGAAEAFALTDEELAVVCGSHGAEAGHVRAVRAVLEKAGLRERDLRCGVHAPLSNKAARALYASGAVPSLVHNNCSGKHAGMLAAARRLGVPLRGYLHPSHPVQRINLRNVARLAGVPARDVARGVDGCSAPTFALPLSGLARAFAVLAGGDGPLARIRSAMTAHPYMVGRPCGAVMSAAPGRIVSKGGAEGLYAAGFPEAGAGVALKCVDGASRPLVHVLAAVVCRLGLLGRKDLSRLAAVADPELRNHAGIRIGRVRVREA